MTREIKTTIQTTRDGIDHEIKIEATYTPGVPNRYPSIKDDVGEPGDPPTVEIESAEIDGETVAMDEDETSRAVEAVLDIANY